MHWETEKFVLLPLLWYLLYCGGLELNLSVFEVCLHVPSRLAQSRYFLGPGRGSRGENNRAFWVLWTQDTLSRQYPRCGVHGTLGTANPVGTRPVSCLELPEGGVRHGNEAQCSETEGNCGVLEQSSRVLSTCPFVPNTKNSEKSETKSHSLMGRQRQSPKLIIYKVKQERPGHGYTMNQA